MSERMERNMDNDDKIKDLVVRSKQFFLKDTGSKDKKQEMYQLDREFAKTKKNRSPIVWISIVLFVAIFAAGSVLVTRYIEKESKRVPVNIEDFADVNLKDVLDRAKKFENQLAVAQRELQDLLEQMNQEITYINEDVKRRIVLLRNQGLSAAQLRTREAAIQDKESADIEAVKADYQPRIDELKARIADIQANIDAYDAQLVERAKAQQEILDSQQRRFEMETAETVGYYESRIDELEATRDKEIATLKEYHDSFVNQLRRNQANEINRLKREHTNEVNRLNREHTNEIARLVLKYNPDFDSPDLRRIISRPMDSRKIRDVEMKRYREVLQEENLLTLNDFRQLREYLSDMSLLITRFQEIPYENSVDPAMDRLEYLGLLVFGQYEDLWSKMADIMTDRNLEIDQFLYALDHLVSSSRENGYVLDARNPERIIVYIDKIHAVRDGDLGYVFRQEDNLIATIRFNVTSREITASLVELTSEDAAMAPFDKILIDLQ